MFRYLTLSATAVYLTGVLVGYFVDPPFGAGWPDISRPLPYLEQSQAELLWSIAGNNISVALINLSGGFSLGIVSLLNTFYNGAVLGYAFSVAWDNFPLPVLSKHLLPHAIEILAIILSCALGLDLGIYLAKKLLLGQESQFDYRLFIGRTALTMAIVLAAAVLEVTFSLSG